jgi:hypothetical protein
MALEQAFLVILEQCGYAPEWSHFLTSTLQFRHLNGPDQGHLITSHSKVDHPWQFSSPQTFGEYPAKESIMRQVLAAGINGWFGVSREQFDFERSVADMRLRVPKMFAKDVK